MLYRSCISLTAVWALVAATMLPGMAVADSPECPGDPGAFPGRAAAASAPAFDEECELGAFPEIGADGRLELCCQQVQDVRELVEAAGIKSRRITKGVLRVERTCAKAESFIAGDDARKERRAYKKVRAVSKKLRTLERRISKLGLGPSVLSSLSEVLAQGQEECSLAEMRLAKLR